MNALLSVIEFIEASILFCASLSQLHIALSISFHIQSLVDSMIGISWSLDINHDLYKLTNQDCWSLALTNRCGVLRSIHSFKSSTLLNVSFGILISSHDLVHSVHPLVLIVLSNV
jgi:hypothetical protein